MKLESALKDQSGYRWVESAISLRTSQGRALLRLCHWYDQSQAAELQQELDGVAAILTLTPLQRERISLALEGLPNFYEEALQWRNGQVWDDVCLFWCKGFLLGLEGLAPLCHGLPAHLQVTPLDVPLALLDPMGEKLAPFSPSTFDPSILTAPPVDSQVLAHHVRAALTAALHPHRAAILEQLEIVGRLDFALGKGELALRYNCIRPRTGDTIRGESMCHPAAMAVLAKANGHFTPITLTLPKGATVITGANMGGKTISLKTVVLNQMLFQTGYYVFAQDYAAPLFDGVALITGDHQNQAGGLSTFGGEVTQVDAALQMPGTLLLAIDEFARGTNPHEGAALAQRLTRHLNATCHTALLTTHYDGVSDVAGSHYRVGGLTQPQAGIPLWAQMDYALYPAPPGAPCPHEAAAICALLPLKSQLGQWLID